MASSVHDYRTCSSWRAYSKTLLKLQSVFRADSAMKIGCSKASCYWCHVYSLNISDRFPEQKVITIATYGKRTKG